jgi:hypothetical protein
MAETIVLSDEQVAALRQAQAAEAQQQQAHLNAAQKAIQIGREEFGTDRFDTARAAFSDLSEQSVAVLLNSDDAPRHIVELANDPEALKKFKELPLNRQQQFLDRRQKDLAPYGHVHTGPTPQWQMRDNSGRLSDSNWNSRAQDFLSDDQWSKEYDRRMAKRFEDRKWKGRG